MSLLTLLDWAKGLDPNGSQAMVAEVLSQKNRMVEKMPFRQGNLTTGHRATIRTGLPTPTWRMFNQGVAPTKSSKAQIDFQCGMMEDRSHADVELANLGGNPKEFRFSESKAHLEGMAQEGAATMFYGSPSNPNEFVGLAHYYNDLTAESSDNIILCGGSGSDQTSIYLTGFGENATYGIFPKGFTSGLSHRDLGEDDVNDEDGNPFRAYKDLYQWKLGLVVEDWRYNVRIANIEVSDLTARTSTQAVTASTSVIYAMMSAIDLIPDPNAVDLSFQANRTVLAALRKIYFDKSSDVVTIEPAVNQFGKSIHALKFMGIPVEMNDALINTEQALS